MTENQTAKPIHLDTDIRGAVALLGNPPAPKFTLANNLFHFHRAKAEEKRKRKGIKSFIRPENADEVVASLPVDPDDRLHCVLRGDFVICDLIARIIVSRGRCPHLRIATLGMSPANAVTLAELVESGAVGKLTLVVSHYFRQVDKLTAFRQVSARLDGLAEIVVARNHAKVILIPTDAGDSYVIEGSANLRSSDNLEQMFVVNDEETHAFHANWLDHLAQCPL